MMEWTYCKDKAPPTRGKFYLVSIRSDAGPYVDTAFFGSYGKWQHSFYHAIFSYMPLPDPAPLPEEE